MKQMLIYEDIVPVTRETHAETPKETAGETLDTSHLSSIFSNRYPFCPSRHEPVGRLYTSFLSLRRPLARTARRLHSRPQSVV